MPTSGNLETLAILKKQNNFTLSLQACISYVFTRKPSLFITSAGLVESVVSSMKYQRLTGKPGYGSLEYRYSGRLQNRILCL